MKLTNKILLCKHFLIKTINEQLKNISRIGH
ncbi:MAG: transposase [cyanobacterium endosymbiont of Rhopalodia yunnanensis]